MTGSSRGILDFCNIRVKYRYEPANKESAASFVQQLKDKNQTELQREQVFDAGSIFYQIEK